MRRSPSEDTIAPLEDITKNGHSNNNNSNNNKRRRASLPHQAILVRTRLTSLTSRHLSVVTFISYLQDSAKQLLKDRGGGGNRKLSPMDPTPPTSNANAVAKEEEEPFWGSDLEEELEKDLQVEHDAKSNDGGFESAEEEEEEEEGEEASVPHAAVNR